ncbi:MAG: FecR family protein [Bryobacteraceae bacterium]
MRSDYLWDGSGEPDPEVLRLERLLSEFRSDRPAPALPAGIPPAKPALRWAAVAATVVVAAAGAWLSTGSAPRAWRVAEPVAEVASLAVGQVLETGNSGTITVAIGNIGEVEVGANSRLRLVRDSRAQHRIRLDRGRIHARIWAPPRSFVVDTPSAAAIDLGCAYTLDVKRDGSGLVTVTSGWVSFQRDGRESFIPAGASCQTRPGVGPGTPYREEASPQFRGALQDLDFSHGGDAALSVVLSLATREDAFTLWHLLSRCPAAQKPRVYDTMAALVPPPTSVTRDGILRADRKMLDAWWDALDLGNTRWWRRYEGAWPDSPVIR